MHFDRPMAERGQDVVSHHGVVGVDGVAGSGVVPIVALVAGQGVKDRVIDTPETERRAQLVSLRGVIEDHIQNHFNAGIVKSPHHFLELQLLLAHASGTAVGSFGCKKRYRIVSPVVPEGLMRLRIAARDGMLVELLHGHQFYSSHSQSFEIRDLFHQAEVGSRMVHARLGMDGTAANVRFVDDGCRPRMPQWPVSIPIEGIVDQDALGH